MTAVDDLLPAVLAEPEDDLPRLAYADALDETGDPICTGRAEFICLQCELARLESAGRDVPTESLLALRSRERTLQAKFGQAWLEPLRRRGEPLFSPRSHGLFRRGFVEVVWMPAGQFLWKAAKLFERAPVRELRVTLAGVEELPELLHVPELAKLNALDLSDRKLGDRLAFEIARSPHQTHWKQLRLKACALTDAGAVDLANAPLLRTLDRLEVPWNNFSEFGRGVLLRAYGHRVSFDE